MSRARKVRTIVWLVFFASIAAMLMRPRLFRREPLPEWISVSVGAVLLVGLRLISFGDAASAVGKGLDVYLFLTGMMLLSELARREGVFDWLASQARSHAKGSSLRLFTLIYAVGTLVTIFLSNDATAVVLTPAVYTVVKQARVKALPYLLACAFVANAASFVLPVSNPANLVVFGKAMPALRQWLAWFALPSLVSIVLTFAVLSVLTRRDLADQPAPGEKAASLSASGRTTLGGIGLTAIVLTTCSALRIDLGAPTLITALLVFGAIAVADHDAIREVPRQVSWSVLPLVAGLFVLVEAIGKAGAVAWTQQSLAWFATLPPLGGLLGSAFATGALCNLINNLPAGLLASLALDAAKPGLGIQAATLIGVDLGPNLSVTGSLATLLWLLALRREGESISALEFLRYGLLVMTIPMAAAVCTLLLLA